MDMHPKVYIVIPVHNRKQYTQACLESLKKQTIKTTCVVIDDGSTDGTSDMVRSHFPDVPLLNGDGNLWWTGATNLGVQFALDHGADFIMTLNDDTLAPPDFIENMMFWAEQKPDSLLGAMAVDQSTKKIVYWGERINWLTAKYNPIMDEKAATVKKGIHEVTHFPGRGLLVPAQVFRKIGLYDASRLPHYAADFDFTHRALRAGFKVYCNFDAKLYTYPEASGSVQLVRNRSVRNYFKHLTGIKGSGNLRVFTFYALNNCPKKYLPFFLLQGYVRRVLGYWI